MAGPRVSIRLATDGKAQVQRDFQDIAESGSVQAQRLKAKWESETAQIERATERAARTAERLATISQTPLQQQIGRATSSGFGDPNGTARASAQALAKELDRSEAEARQLVASIDPLFAAQQRYATQVERINRLKATGALSQQRYQQLLAQEKVALDQATAAATRNNQMRGNTRMGMQQLSFQIGDVSQQMALGTRASIIFAQQSGQVIQALQIMGGQGNAFLRFLGGPWGIALATAAVVLTPLIGKLFDAGEGVDDLVEKLRKEAAQSAKNDEAHRIFANTLDGVTAALEKNRAALKELEEQGRTAAERALAAAEAEAFKLELIQFSTEAAIRYTRALHELHEAEVRRAVHSPSDTRLLRAMDARGESESRLRALESTLPGLDAQVAEARRQIADAASRAAVEAGMRDAVEDIRRRYTDPKTGLIEQTRRRLLNEKATTAEIERQTRALRDQMNAEIEAEQKRQRQRRTREPDGDLARFINPVGGGAITGAFGEKRPGHRHAGIDLAVPVATDVRAAAAGVVIEVGQMPGYGNVVIIDHGRGTTTRYAHLSKFLAAPGQQVDAGTVIALSGGAKGAPGSGNSQGPHLHYEVRRSGRAVDPRKGPFPIDLASAGEAAIRQAENAAREIEAMEAATKAALALAQAYLESGSAAARAAAARSVASQAIKQGTDADAAAQRQLAKDVADAAAEGAKNVAVLSAETAVRKAVNDNIAAGTIAARDANRAMQDEALLRPLLALQAIAQGDALKVLTDVINAYRKALQGAHAEEDRSQVLGRIDSIRQQHEDTMLLLQRELQLAGVSADSRERTLQLLQLELQLRRDLIGATDEQIRQILAGADAEEELRRTIEQVVSSVQEFRNIGESALDTVFNIRTIEDWGDAAQQVLDDLANEMIRLALLNPLKNLLFGGNLPTIAGAFAGLLGGTGVTGQAAHAATVAANPPGMASGTEYFSGGLTWVGEFGKELVRLPRGSKITPAGESRRLAAANDGGIGSIVLNMPVDATGADPAAIARLNAKLDELQASLPSQVAAAWIDARERFRFG